MSGEKVSKERRRRIKSLRESTQMRSTSEVRTDGGEETRGRIDIDQMYNKVSLCDASGVSGGQVVNDDVVAALVAAGDPNGMIRSAKIS